MRWGRAVVLAAAILAVCGAFCAPAVAGDDTPTAAPDTAAQATQTASSDTATVAEQDTGTTPAPADAASDPTEPVEQPSAPADAAPQADDPPTSPETSEAAEPQASAPPQAPGASQTAEASQSATATADAAQTGTDNTHVAIHVDDPVDAPGVAQENAVEADATATTGATVTADRTGADGGGTQSATAEDPAPPADSSSPELTVDQHPTATATATQDDVSNLNVSVRVGSPGDDGQVSQANTASATATTGASSTVPAAPGGQSASPEPDPLAGPAQATATQQDVSNTNVSVRVFSPGDAGPVDQANAAAATAASDQDPGPESGPSSFQGTDATVSQDSVRNTNVSIRIASPGADAGLTQTTNATTNGNGTTLASAGSPVTTPVTTTVGSNGLDTNVAIALNGNALPQPLAGANGTISVWRWTWTWDGSEAQIPDDVTSWDWFWNGDGTTPAHGTVSVSEEPVGSAPPAGSLSWTWAWTRPGNWSWSWDKTLPLDCACAWVWSWNWDWTTEPAQAEATPDATQLGGDPAAAGEPQVSQANTVTAVASASADAAIVETVVQTDPAGTQPTFAGQIVTVIQTVTATATALQHGSANIVGKVGSALQSNSVSVEATAAAAADADQRIDQGNEQDSNGSEAGQWAGQQTDVGQSVSATATGLQLDVVITDPHGSADVLASAFSSAVATSQQHVGQANGPGAGSRSQWAGQQVDADQIAISDAGTSQAGGDPIRVRMSRAVAAALVIAAAFQSSDQLAAGDVDGSQVSRQLIESLQGASATAVTTQPAKPHVGPQGDAYASSDAGASGAALTEQTSTQISLEGGEQDVTQNTFVVQTADATSESAGGIAGRATVVNCATAQQSSRQGMGAAAIGSEPGDASAFCTPPTADPGSGTAAPAPSLGEMPVAGAAGVFGEEPPRHGFTPLRTTTIPPSHTVTTVRQDADAAPPIAVTTPRTAAGLAPELSTPTLERPAQTPLEGHERVGKAVGEPAPPSAPDSDIGSGTANPAPGAGGGVADTPSPLHLAPPSDRRRWDLPAVRRSAFSSGRYETPG